MIRALRILLYVILALVVVVGLLLAFLATPPGRAVVASLVERVAAGSGLSVSIGRLTGWPPFSFGADRIVIADAEGPFAEVEGLAVDLAIGGLLRREIVFDALHADRVALSRTPVLPPSEGDSGGAGLALAARQLSVARLELGEPLVANPAALSVTGSFETTAGGRLAARIDANRIDGPQGRLAAQVDRASGTAPLMVDVTLQEAQDGILLGLLGRDSGPAYRLTAQTGIVDGAFDGTLALVSDGDARFDGRFALSPASDGGQRLVLNGEGDLAELLPPAFADLLSGAIQVAIDATWRQEAGQRLPEVVVHEGRIATGALRAEASGSFGTATSDLSLTLDAAAPDGRRLVLPFGGGDAVALDSIDVSGRIAPEGGVTRLDLIGNAAGLAFGDVAVPALGFSLAVEAPGDDPLAATGLPFALRAEADALRLGDRTIPGGEDSPIVASAHGTLDLDTMRAETTAEATIAGGRATYAGSVGADAVTGRAEVDIADVEPFAALMGQAMHGRFVATAEGTFVGPEGLDIAVDGRGDAFASGIDVVDRLLGPAVHIAATLRDAPAGLAVSDLAVEGAQATLGGSATLAGDTIDATLTGRVADLGALASGTTGEASIEARVSGTLSAPNVDATVTVAEGTVAGQAIADASVRIEGTPAEAGWQGTLTLGGTLADLPLTGTATAITAGGGVSFPAIDLTVLGNRITGALAANPDGLLSGTLDIDGTNLETLAALAAVDATGTATARATFTSEAERQTIAATFAARDLAVEGVSVAQADGEVRIDDAFGAPTIAGRADLGTMAVGTFAIDTAAISASVEDGVTSFEASAAGPDLTLRGTGNLATEPGTTTVRLATLEGTAFGLPVDLAAPADITIADGVTRLSGVALAAGGGQLTAEGAVSPNLDLRVTADNVAASFLNAVVPDLDASGTITANATVTGTPDSPAFAWTANWADLALPAMDGIGLPPLAVTAHGEGTAVSTSVMAEATGGGLTLRADGTVPFDGSATDIAVTGEARGVDLGQPLLARLLYGETTLSANVATGENGRIAITDLAIEGSGLDATGSLTLQGDTIDANVDGRIADLALLAEQSSGEATFNARITGSTARPDVSATVVVPDGTMLGQPVDGASVSFTGAPTEDGGWDGALTLGGAFAGHPLSGTAQATLADTGGLSLPDVDLRVGENRITGAIGRTPAGLLEGSLDVSAPNLTSLAALALVEATGTAQGRVVFTPDGGRQSVSLSVNGQNISMPSVALARIDAEAQVEDAFGVPMVRGRAEASGLVAGDVRIDTATVTASVVDGATQFEATARGPDLNLSGAGSLANDDGAQVIAISRLSGSAFGFPVDIASPATVRMAEGETRISGVSLSVGGGRVAAEGTIASEIALDVTVTNVAGAFLNRFAADLDASGTISGSARVTGTPQAPRIAWRIDWAGFNVAAARNAGVPAMALAASGVASGTATTVDASLAGGGVSLTVTGNVPFSGPGLQVRAQGTAPLALLTADSGGDLAVDGTTRIDLTVNGSTASPAINGTFDIVNARVADASDGIGVSGLNGRIQFDGRTARVQQLTGNLTQGGELVVAGTIGVDPGSGFPADITIRVRNGRYLDGTMINANFNADLTLRGPVLGGATIAGTVDLGRTEILLPESFGGGPPITVDHIYVAPGFVPPMQTLQRPGAPPPTSRGSSDFNLNLTVNSTNVIYVRGFGLDAELGGSIRVEGTTGDPRPIGGFEMRRGRIEVLGQRFDFDRGILTFQGDMDPVLDFAAVTTTADITATVMVTGPARDPEISLSAVPDMPEEEIISRLLFGRSIGSLSAFQTVRLVDAIAEFSGAYGRDGGIFARVRRTVGLDDLDIDQNAAGGTTITVGKQISDKVHVGVQTETNGSSRITLDVDLTRNLKAQIEGGANGGGSVGLTFEKEY